jgi:hypothetical protein
LEPEAFYRPQAIAAPHQTIAMKKTIGVFTDAASGAHF